ncbi:MAG: superoxide dismutase [Turicibacter sp.]
MEKFTLPELPYAYNALEPFLDALTLEIHYCKHHAAYTKNLNALVPGHESFFDNKTIEEILSHVDEIPEDIRQAVINQGGGYANHNLYWTMLSPNGGGEPYGKLARKIKETFGSFEKMKDLLSKAAVSQFGSGWGWLVVNQNGELEIMQTLNQNSPLSVGKTPILTIDVWEHAYYLKFQNRRPEFVDIIWNVINWDEVESRFEKALM